MWHQIDATHFVHYFLVPIGLSKKERQNQLCFSFNLCSCLNLVNPLGVDVCMYVGIFLDLVSIVLF